jgi:glucose/arabinose dehydrogenase
MTVRTILSSLFGCALLLMLPHPSLVAKAPEPERPTARKPLFFDTASGQRIKVSLVAGGLVHPYSLSFTDAHTLLVAERSGRLRIVRDGMLLPKPAWEAPPAPAGAPAPSAGPEALHFIALHPAFATNHLVYLSYPKYGPRGSTMAVGRGTLQGDVLEGFQEIFAAEAWGTAGANPGQMMFLRDGTLLVTVGDRDGFCCDGSENTSQRMKAQELDNDFGKILRIREDGSVPPDNPFVGRDGARPEIYTYGNRNAYGLAYHPETGELWESEIGPLGGDEVNILKPGHNYGWPLVSTGRNYTGTEVSDHPWSREGMDNPRMFWVPSISPSGLIFYTGDRFKGWKNNIFLGALNGKALWRVSFKQPRQAEQREVLLPSLNVRMRDVQQGPDGNLYVATELEAGGAALTGTVLKIEPAS